MRYMSGRQGKLWVEVVSHLATFNLVPPLNEVLDNVKHNGAINCHVHLSLYVSLR